jgi:hypothetical protein
MPEVLIMMLSKILNTTGLLLDIVGVFLVFRRFDLKSIMTIEQGRQQRFWSGLPDDEYRKERREALFYWGMILCGFTLQIISNWINEILVLILSQH